MTTANESDLEEECRLLQVENDQLRARLDSRRYRMADLLADTANRLVPPQSRPRVAVGALVRDMGRLRTRGERRPRNLAAARLITMASGYENIIFIRSIGWAAPLQQRPHHLAREFARQGFFTVYLEYEGESETIEVIAENLVVIDNRELLKCRFTNRHKYFLLTSLAASPKPEFYADLVHHYGFSLIYDYIDAMHADISPAVSDQVEIWQALPDIGVTLGLASATVLKTQLSRHLPDTEVVLARNSVNVDHFDFTRLVPEAPPVDLRPILEDGRPIVGFYGALAPWLDYDLLNALSARRPDYHFVYIGEDYGGVRADLVIRDNVHCLGVKEYDDLPRYSRHFSCAIIPFGLGEIAKATSPVKLYEYMAMGLPTVCTRDLVECGGHPWVYLSEDNAAFEADVERAINDRQDLRKRESLLAQARQNTWAAVVQEVVRALRRAD